MPSRQPKRTVETRRSKLRCYQKPALGRFFHVPQKLLSILEFQRGDKFEVMEKDGGIPLSGCRLSKRKTDSYAATDGEKANPVTAAKIYIDRPHRRA